MTFIDLNFNQFYQSLIKISLSFNRVLKTLNANETLIAEEKKPLKTLKSSNEWSALWDDDVIKFVNIMTSLQREYLSSFCESASDLKNIKADAEDKISVVLW